MNPFNSAPAVVAHPQFKPSTLTQNTHRMQTRPMKTNLSNPLRLAVRQLAVLALLVAVLCLGPSAKATTYTNSVAGYWSAAGSWTGGSSVPPTGGALDAIIQFKPTAALNSTNDLASTTFLLNQMSLVAAFATTNTSVNSLVFTNASALITNSVATNLVINSAVTLGANLTVGAVASGSIILNSNISQSVTGSSLTKLGAGTLILTASNSYTGGTTLSAGILEVDNNNAIGAGPLIISAASTLTNNVNGVILTNNIGMAAATTIGIPAGTTNIFGGIITNMSGSFTKQGLGTLVLTNILTNSAPLAVNAGTLVLNGVTGIQGSGGSTYKVDTGGTLVIGNTTPVYGSSAAFTLGNASGSTGTVNHTNGASTYTSTVAGPVIGAAVGGIGIYNLSGGTLTTIAGSLTKGVLLGNASSSTGTFNLSGTGTLNVLSGSTLQISGSVVAIGVTNATGVFNQTNGTANVAELRMAGADSFSVSNTATLNLQGGTFIATNFTYLSAGNYCTSSIAISGADVSLNSFPTTRGTGSAATLTLNGAVLRSLTPVNPTANNNYLTFMGGLTAAYIQTNGVTINTANGSITIGQNLLTDPVSTGGGLTNAGANTLTLSGINTYTGPTVITAGELVGATGGSSSNSAVTVSAGATNGVQVLAAGGQWVCKTLTYNAGTTYVDFDFGGLTPSTATAPLQVTNALTFNSTPTVLLRNLVGVTNGVYPLIQYGSVSGAVPTAFTSAFVSGSISNDTVHNVLVAVVIGGNSANNPLLWSTNSGNWNINATANWKDTTGVAGKVYVDGTTVILDDTATGAGTILVTNTVVVSPASVTVNVTNKNYTISGSAIAGYGVLTKNGTGTLTLNGTNTYSGGTVVNGGTVVAANTTAAIGTGLLTLNSGTTLSNRVTGSLLNPINLAGNGTVGTLSGMTLTAGNNITNSGSLTLSGAGTVTLTGSNTFSGGLVLNGGTLTASSDGNLGASGVAVTVTANSTLALGQGATYNRSIFLNGANLFSPGNNNPIITGPVTGSGSITNNGGNSGGSSLTLSSANNTFTGSVNLGYGANASSTGPTITVASLADSVGAGNIVFNYTWPASTTTFSYAANAVVPLALTNRQIVLATPAGANGIPNNTIQNNNATYPIIIIKDLSVTATYVGTHPLILGAVAGPTNVFAGNIGDGTSGVFVSLSKSGGGTWVLSGNVTNSGPLNVGAGILKMSGTNSNFNVLQAGTLNPPGANYFLGLQSLPSTASISVSHTGGSGGLQNFFLLDDSATPASRSGVNLNFTNQNNSQNTFGVFVGNNSLANGGTSSSTTTGSTIQLGNLNFAQGVAAATLGQGIIVTNANGYKLQLANVNVNLVAAYASAWPVLLQADGPLLISGNVQQAAGSGGTTTLQLAGVSTGSSFSGNILNSADGTPKALSLTKSGTGTWTLSGANTYSGATTISAGTLIINGNSAGVTNLVTVSANATLGGAGTIGGMVTNLANSTLLVGSAYGSAGTLTLTNGLGLNGAKLIFSLTNTTAGNYSQVAITNGTFIVNGNNTIQLVAAGALPTGIYTLITNWGAGRTLSANQFVFAQTGTTNWTPSAGATLTITNGPNSVVLAVSGASATLPPGVWKGAVNNTWDTATPNWFGGLYADGQAAIFDDTASLFTVVNGAGFSPNPGSVTFSNSANAYTIAVPIQGSGALTNAGTGVTVLAATNSYTGGTFVNAGTLVAGSTINAFGGGLVTLNGGSLSNNVTATLTNSLNLAANVTVGVVANTTLTLNGVITNSTSVATNLIKVGAGTLTLNPGANTDTVSNLVVAAGTNLITGGTVTVSAAGTANSGTTGSGLIISGSSSALTVAGGTVNTTTFVSINGGGTLNINSGVFNLTGGNSLLCGYASAGTVNLNGGTLSLSSLKLQPTGSTGVANLNGGTLKTSAINYGAGTGIVNFNGATVQATASTTGFTYVTNNMTYNISTNGLVFDSQAFSVTNGSPLVHNSVLGATADGGLTKIGTGTLTLTNANTYMGNTTISTGTLALASSGLITNSASIVVASNAIFNVSGLSSAFTLQQATSQTLSNSAPGAIINGTNNCSAGTISLVYDGVNPSFIQTNGGMTLSSSTTFMVNNTGGNLAAGSYLLIATNANGLVTNNGTGLPAVTLGGNTNGVTSVSLVNTNYQLYLVVASGGGGGSTIVTTNTLTPVGSSAAYGSLVTFTSTVQTNSPLGTATTAGSNVVFYVGSTAVATNPVNSGVATYSVGNLTVGSYTVTAAYLGDGTNLPSTNSVSLTITQAVAVYTAGVSLVSSSPTNGYHSGVNFTSAVPAYVNSGSVIFLATNGGFGAVISTNGITNGIAYSLTITNLPRGTNVITAQYAGDANVLGWTNSISQVTTNHPPAAGNYNLSWGKGTANKDIAITNVLANATDADQDVLTLISVPTISSNGVVLTTNAINIQYTGPLTNDDSFAYTISDGNGGTAVGYVIIAATNSVSAPSGSIGVVGGQATVVFFGITGDQYVVERNTNLTSGIWVPISTNTAPDSGAITNTDYFLDLGGNIPGAAYYRLQTH